jgi:hypothetical protein
MVYSTYMEQSVPPAWTSETYSMNMAVKEGLKQLFLLMRQFSYLVVNGTS